MTRDEIVRMSREAGFDFNSLGGTYTSGKLDENLERFSAIVAAAEREACAELAEKTVCDTHIPTGINIYGTRAAKAIRARGKK